MSEVHETTTAEGARVGAERVAEGDRVLAPGGVEGVVTFAQGASATVLLDSGRVVVCAASRLRAVEGARG